jgi:TPR repeat protein
MNKMNPSGMSLKARLTCAIWCGLMASGALAAPQQDVELAEREFARGDIMAAMGLWRKAAQEGYAPAQTRLGEILDKAEEDQEAFEWFLKAAGQGYAAGEDNLGRMYAKGEGVKQDIEVARMYILRAAEKSHPPAVEYMMDAYRRGGLGFAIDETKAAEWEIKLMALVPTYKKFQPNVAGKNSKGKTK